MWNSSEIWSGPQETVPYPPQKPLTHNFCNPSVVIVLTLERFVCLPLVCNNSLRLPWILFSLMLIIHLHKHLRERIYIARWILMLPSAQSSHRSFRKQRLRWASSAQIQLPAIIARCLTSWRVPDTLVTASRYSFQGQQLGKYKIKAGWEISCCYCKSAIFVYKCNLHYTSPLQFHLFSFWRNAPIPLFPVLYLIFKHLPQ